MSKGSKAVFVSYPNEDSSTAQAILAALEKNRVSCWIAPRDIPPGETWAKAIVDGIRQCRVMVMVFSEASKASEHVAREIHLAVEAGQPIFLFRTGRAELSSELSYFLSTHQFVDIQASPKPKSAQLGTLVSGVKKVLREKGVKVSDVRKWSWKGRVIQAAAVLAVLYVTIFGGFLAIDEWLDHGKSPGDAALSALGGLIVTPGTVFAGGGSESKAPTAPTAKERKEMAERFTTRPDPLPGETARDLADLMHLVSSHPLEPEDDAGSATPGAAGPPELVTPKEAEDLAELMYFASRLEESFRRKQSAKWFFSDGTEDDFNAFVRAYRRIVAEAGVPALTEEGFWESGDKDE